MTETQTGHQSSNSIGRLVSQSNIAVTVGIAGDLFRYGGILGGLHAVINRGNPNGIELLAATAFYLSGAYLGRMSSQDVAYREAQRALLTLDQHVADQTEVTPK